MLSFMFRDRWWRRSLKQPAGSLSSVPAELVAVVVIPDHRSGITHRHTGRPCSASINTHLTHQILPRAIVVDDAIVVVENSGASAGYGVLYTATNQRR